MLHDRMHEILVMPKLHVPRFSTAVFSTQVQDIQISSHQQCNNCWTFTLFMRCCNGHLQRFRLWQSFSDWHDNINLHVHYEWEITDFGNRKFTHLQDLAVTTKRSVKLKHLFYLNIVDYFLTETCKYWVMTHPMS